MISRPQQILLKRAQREAALSDDEYREALELVTGCRSSRDPKLADRNLDALLGYFEAIHWRKADAGTLQPNGSRTAVFRQRGYWAAKNTRLETSRDRYNQFNLGQSIADLEGRLKTLGFGEEYCEGIRTKSAQSRTDARGLHFYHAALTRTVNAKATARIGATSPV